MAHVALVTGAGRGIGRAIAIALARTGVAVAVAARTRGQIDATARDIQAAGGKALAVRLDVTDDAAIAPALASVVSGLGPIDIVVNNAGIAEAAPFARTTQELWERHFRVNATGPYLVTRATLPGMLARGWGRVVNIASTAGLAGAPYVAAYTASKHALIGLTRALAAEVAGQGVTVNAVCPGFAATDIVWNGARAIAARTGRAFDDAVASMAQLNPGGRLIEPTEVAQVVLALIEDGQRHGETVVLDGSTTERRTS